MALVGKMQDMHDDHVYVCMYLIYMNVTKHINIKSIYYKKELE